MFLYPIAGENIMKGRTKCPKCNYDYILDIPKYEEKYITVCPNCNNKFTIKKSIECTDLEDECIWEEHGEPRKTILSAIKPRTDKPMIASLLLSIVFIVDIISAISIQITPEIFFDSTFIFITYIKLNINDLSIIFSLIIMIFSIFAFAGSIYSYKRNHLNVAIICVFISLFSMGFYFIGSLLSLIALIIIYYSREEFTDEKRGKIF